MATPETRDDEVHTGRFYNLTPHPDEPIRHETFARLDSLVVGLEAAAEIEAVNRFDRRTAVAKATEEHPLLTVDRYEGPRGLRVISLCAVTCEAGEVDSLLSPRTFKTLLVRNDCGTAEEPMEPAATFDDIEVATGRGVFMAQESRQVSDTELQYVSASLEYFLETREFSPLSAKEQQIFIPTIYYGSK